MRGPLLQIDVRKAFDAGIGTYIRGVVPRVIDRVRGEIEVEILAQADRPENVAWATQFEAPVVRSRSRPLSVSEQIELRRSVGNNRLFWATSIAHPLFASAPLFATVHDLAQVYGGASVVPRHRALAARAYFRSLLRSARGLVCVSRYTFDQLLRFHRRELSIPFAITPLGVEPRWRQQPVSTPSSVPYFVWVGSIRPHKNVTTLVRAFLRVADEIPHRLVIAGGTSTMDDGLRRALRDAASRHPARIHLAGQVPDEELVALVAGATAMVFPSRYEGFGLPPLEAMAAGCPVIASGVTSIPEVAGDAARYFDPDSLTQLAGLLVEFANLSAADRERRVKAGQRRSDLFTWDRCAELTATTLLRCVDEHRSRVAIQ